jgi:hypothetical protein
MECRIVYSHHLPQMPLADEVDKIRWEMWYYLIVEIMRFSWVRMLIVMRMVKMYILRRRGVYVRLVIDRYTRRKKARRRLHHSWTQSTFACCLHRRGAIARKSPKRFLVHMINLVRDHCLLPHSIRATLNGNLFSCSGWCRFFVVQSELGRGARGVVLKVTHVLDNIPLGDYAVKRVPLYPDFTNSGRCRR